MRAWLATLAGRITLVTATATIAAVLITAGVAFPLIRAAALDQARSELAQSADRFSATPAASIALLQRQQRLLGSGDSDFVVILPDGTVDGETQTQLQPALVKRLLDGQSVSDTVGQGGSRMLLEGRPTRGGGAVVLTRPLDTVYAATGQVAVRLGIALLVGLVVALLLGTWLARRLARPLAEAAVSARRLARGERGLSGPLVDAASPHPAENEPSHAASEIRDVAAALAALDRALATSEGRQREFLLSISHDIRSPLTALRGYAEALSDGLVAADDVPAVGATLVAETERLNSFVSDLLELARLEADDFRVDASAVDLARIARSAEQAWAARCAQQGIRLSTDLPDEPVVVVADAQRVRQIVDALVENAVRVTPGGASISLIVGKEGMITVHDGGPGLSEADSEVAFERGVLRDRYVGERPVGTGLGLSIASRLAGRMGGSLGVRSAPDGGAVFELSLALHPDA